MFNVTGGEFLIIFLVALVVLGPTKLPEAARQVGKIVGEFRRISSGFQRELQSAMNDPVSKVTGEPTPKTLKDVTSVADVPPMAEPATPSMGNEDDPDEDHDAGSKATSTQVSNTPATGQEESLESDEPFVPIDPVDDADPEDPPMYGDR